MVTIIKAKEEHLQELVALFDSYRMFYGQESDQAAAMNFLRERMVNSESIVFIAFSENQAVGFTQLYTTFSSVSLERYYILNDLFVKPKHRNKGVGLKLLNRAKTLCIDNGFKGVALETATDNPAQKLYEKLGWKRNSQYFHYFWSP